MSHYFSSSLKLVWNIILNFVLKSISTKMYNLYVNAFDECIFLEYAQCLFHQHLLKDGSQTNVPCDSEWGTAASLAYAWGWGKCTEKPMAGWTDGRQGGSWASSGRMRRGPAAGAAAAAAGWPRLTVLRDLPFQSTFTTPYVDCRTMPISTIYTFIPSPSLLAVRPSVSRSCIVLVVVKDGPLWLDVWRSVIYI